LKNLAINGSDIFAHPPSGATFWIHNNRLPLHVAFTPAFSSDVPVDKTDGVTFQVWNGSTKIFDKHCKPTDRVEPEVLSVEQGVNSDSIGISFVTTPGPANNFEYDWAIWKNVKFIEGNGYIDPSKISDEALRRAWEDYNPVLIGKN